MTDYIKQLREAIVSEQRKATEAAPGDPDNGLMARVERLEKVVVALSDAMKKLEESTRATYAASSAYREVMRDLMRNGDDGK